MLDLGQQKDYFASTETPVRDSILPRPSQNGDRMQRNDARQFLRCKSEFGFVSQWVCFAVHDGRFVRFQFRPSCPSFTGLLLLPAGVAGMTLSHVRFPSVAFRRIKGIGVIPQSQPVPPQLCV